MKYFCLLIYTRHHNAFQIKQHIFPWVTPYRSNLSHNEHDKHFDNNTILYIGMKILQTRRYEISNQMLSLFDRYVDRSCWIVKCWKHWKLLKAYYEQSCQVWEYPLQLGIATQDYTFEKFQPPHLQNVKTLGQYCEAHVLWIVAWFTTDKKLNTLAKNCYFIQTQNTKNQQQTIPHWSK